MRRIRKPTKATLAAKAAFDTRIRAILEQAGATLGQWGEYTLETRYGHLSAHPTMFYDECTVFCRFSDPARAAHGVDCNPYSGKWNFHYGSGHTLAEAADLAEDFAARLSVILLPQEAPSCS